MGQDPKTRFAADGLGLRSSVRQYSAVTRSQPC